MGISVHLAVRRQSGDIVSLNKRHIQHLLDALKHTINYRISGIFRVGLIFAEFATCLKSPNIDTAKNKPYYTSPLRVL